MRITEPDERRFWAKVQLPDVNGCLNWTGTKTWGYGQFALKLSGRRSPVKAHRFAYELLVGPIPEGMTLDHLCRNRGCVNVSHLEAVPMHINWRRGESPTAQNSRKTHCKHGHALTPDNIYTPPKRANARYCLKCAELANQRRRGLHSGPKTYCKHGHSLSGENLYVDPKGGRRCRTCRFLRDGWGGPRSNASNPPPGHAG